MRNILCGSYGNAIKSRKIKLKDLNSSAHSPYYIQAASDGKNNTG
jgi:hypothetical protein